MVNLAPALAILLFLSGCSSIYSNSFGASHSVEDVERNDIKNDGRLHPYFYPYLQKDDTLTYFVGVKRTFFPPLDPKLAKNAKKHQLK